MAWCCQAASHYLTQCWPGSMLLCGLSRPHWIITFACHHLSRCKGYQRLRTDGRTDGQGESSIPPSNFVGRGYNKLLCRRCQWSRSLTHLDILQYTIDKYGSTVHFTWPYRVLLMFDNSHRSPQTHFVIKCIYQIRWNRIASLLRKCQTQLLCKCHMRADDNRSIISIQVDWVAHQQISVSIIQ